MTLSEARVREVGHLVLILEAHYTKHIEGMRLTLEWVISNEIGNELGNDPSLRNGLIFARGLRHSLRQTYGSTCDTPFGKVSGKMGLSKFPPCRGPHAL